MLSKKLSLAVKKVKRNIRQTQENCTEVWNRRKNPRGVLVCQMIHFMSVFITAVGAFPFRVVKLEKTYRLWFPVEGARKWLVNGIHTYIILRAVSYALLPTLSKLKLVQGGMLTADCLIWAVSVEIAAVPAIVCSQVAINKREAALIFNGLMELLRSASKKHLKGKHIFELSEIHWAVVGLLAGATAATILMPVLSIPIFIPLKDSPVFISYHLTGPYADIEDGDTVKIAAYWFGALVHWLYLNYLGWLMILMMVIIGEAIIGLTILLKIISSHDSTTMRWREKLKLHAQLEYVINMLNDYAGMTAPIIVLSGLMFTVCCNLVLMKMDLEIGFPSVNLIPVYICMGGGGAVGVCIFLRYAEAFRANSIAYLADVEAEITAHVMLDVRRGRKVKYYPTGRTFRRRPVGIKLGNFMLMDDGIGISYLMQVVDNVVNYYFMVDLRAQPIWLW